MLSRVADALFWMSRNVERAEQVARLLDVCFHLELDLSGVLDIQYHLLRELNDPADLSLSNLQWAAVLRSCSAYEAYQRLYVGRVEPERVVEFLLLHPTFPRSVRFCLEEASRALTAIEGA